MRMNLIRSVMIYARIKAFVERLAPELVCERCVAERLGVSEEQTPGVILHELAAQSEFERQIGPCALCGESTQPAPHLGKSLQTAPSRPFTQARRDLIFTQS